MEIKTFFFVAHVSPRKIAGPKNTESPIAGDFEPKKVFHWCRDHEMGVPKVDARNLR